MLLSPSFDSLTLACVADELQLLIGARVQRISQPNATQIVLTLHSPHAGERFWLLDCSAPHARTHLITRRAPKIAGNVVPPPFCMTLRKYLDGARLEHVSQRGFDRILDAHFLGSHAFVSLSCEMMGKHSNLLLIEGSGLVLQAAKLIPSRLNRVREILPGRRYIEPPSSGKPDPRLETAAHFQRHLEADAPDDFAAWLRQNYEGMSGFLAREITLLRADDSLEASWQAFADVFTAARDHRWSPVFLRDSEGAIAGAYPLRVSGFQGEARSINAALEEFYGKAIPRLELDSARKSLGGVLSKTRRAREDALKQVERGLGESSRAARNRHWGELLLAYAHEIEAGVERAILPDWETENVPVEIPLDRELSVFENAEKYFERARKSQNGEAKLGELKTRLSREADKLRDMEAQVETASSEELAAIRDRANTAGWLQWQAGAANVGIEGEVGEGKRPFEGKKVRVETSPQGWTILVGENAEANDYLVRHGSSPDDWWLHVRAATSSHVVIRTGGAPLRVPMDTLRFAAELCARHSPSKHAGTVAVDYVLRKYVRRPRKAAPGSVTYTREKTLDVAPQAF